VHTAMTSPPAVRGWVASVAELDNGGTGDLGSGPEPGDLAEILYTSGTTGKPKPIAVPHANLTHGRDGRGDLFGGIDSILCAVPAATNAGHSALMVAITTGSTAHVLSHVTAAESAAVIERVGIQQAILTPVVAKQLVAQGLHLEHDLSSVKTLMFGSSAVPAAAMSELSRSLPRAQIMVGYGSTESAPGFCRRMLPSWEEHGDPDFYRDAGLHCLGGPGGGTEACVVGPDGPVPDGRPGEICLRSEAPIRSYLVPGTGPATFGADGWVRMGDVGLIGDDGQLYFVDRAPDAIPAEQGPQSSVRLETALLWHPDVVDVAVVAPGAEPGGEVVAVVEPRAGVDRERVESELTAALHAVLAEAMGVAAPPGRVVLDSLPRGPLGKVRKRDLRARYAPLGAAAV
jgi:long-chain acyl-CoA synthetase